MGLGLNEFTYDLPAELIAQKPAPRRDGSRLMVLDRAGRRIKHSNFADLLRWLPGGGPLIINDVRVVPARLCGRLASGGRVEILVLEPPPADAAPGEYEIECLAKPGRRLKPGVEIILGPDLIAEVERTDGKGRYFLKMTFTRPPLEVIETLGRMPLPPYIKRGTDRAEDDRLDRERYQTIYAARSGAVAAPTAGLHFTPELLEEVRDAGLDIRALTLWVGYGTFAPVRVKDISRHRMQAERVRVPEDVAEAVNRAKAAGRPITAVGTTVVRSLEFTAGNDGRITTYDGPCDLFISPGYEFKVVDHLITNFHLPGTTLLMLVAALAGLDFILEAYRLAVAERYRFFSYGDAMLIL
ncbi:MAG: tRNA preQ1(34) S-adenosylmethionine ribosyltransferase-isomerase QueA [Thermodesulfobacteriota bacterium]